MTVKQDAVTHQISERTLYMGRKLHRLGREDLVNAVMRGEIKLYRALQIADGKSNPTRLDKAVHRMAAVFGRGPGRVPARYPGSV